MKDNNRYSYDADGAAEYLGISKTAIYALRKTGFLNCLMIGRNYIFPKKELDRFDYLCKTDIEFNNKVREVI